MKGEIFMSKKKIQALITQLAVHDIFGQFRYFKKDNGEIWFVAVDVAKILGYKNGSRDIYRHVDAEDREVVRLSTETVPNLGGNPNKIIINESGLYSLIFGSKLPTAKKFTRWVTSEVLPSIRKNGFYALPNKKIFEVTEEELKFLEEKYPNLEIKEIIDDWVENEELKNGEGDVVVTYQICLG